MTAYGLTRALERAGIPIVGVSVGREDDRTTWRCDFRDTATAAQRAHAASLMATYDAATDALLAQDLADKALALKALMSLARATWEQLPLGKPTWLEFLARWKAIYLTNGAM